MGLFIRLGGFYSSSFDARRGVHPEGENSVLKGRGEGMHGLHELAWVDMWKMELDSSYACCLGVEADLRRPFATTDVEFGRGIDGEGVASLCVG